MFQELFGLDGRVAVITGGSGAIGQGAARIFLELGAKVILAGRTEEHLAAARQRSGPAPRDDGARGCA